jgi:hypothetical protein
MSTIAVGDEVGKRGKRETEKRRSGETEDRKQWSFEKRTGQRAHELIIY